jgi:hypothetical protein
VFVAVTLSMYAYLSIHQTGFCTSSFYLLYQLSWFLESEAVKSCVHNNTTRLSKPEIKSLPEISFLQSVTNSCFVLFVDQLLQRYVKYVVELTFNSHHRGDKENEISQTSIGSFSLEVECMLK